MSDKQLLNNSVVAISSHSMLTSVTSLVLVFD